MTQDYKIIYGLVDFGSIDVNMIDFENKVNVAKDEQGMQLVGNAFGFPLGDGKALICQAALHDINMEAIMRSMAEQSPVLANMDEIMADLHTAPGPFVPGIIPDLESGNGGKDE